MGFPTYDEAEALKRAWTDKFVRIKPGYAEYEGFANKVGRVVTVNYGAGYSSISRFPLSPVREGTWHFRGARYKYYIEESGKKVSTRYLAVDLAPARPVPDSAFRTPRSAFFPCSS